MTPSQATSPLRAQALTDSAGLAARYPEIYGPNHRARAITLAVVGAMAALLIFGLWRLEFSFLKIINGIGQLGNFLLLMVPPSPDTWAKALMYVQSLIETLAIAFLGTLLAAIIAFPISLLAAKNVVFSRVVHFFTRRSLDMIRGVDTLIWALIWVNVVGLGPFAGVLAIMSSDIGTFGKLFSEAIEASDRKPVEGVRSTGGGAASEIRFGLIPQVFPVIASQVLYYFESNTRSATIIGIVGAGGIGLHLSEQIRTLEWQNVSFLILLILAAVTAIDYISMKLRFAIIGRREGAPV